LYNIYREGTKLNKEPIYVFDMGTKPAYLFADSLGTEGTYNYSYTGLDAFNNESPASASVSISFESPNMPPRPLNVTYDGNSQLSLFWKVNSTASFKGFNIYRADDVKGQFVKINSSLIPSTDTSYVDNTAELNKKYFYYVSSEGSPGFTNNSSVIAAVSADYSKPSAPENLTAVSDSVKVQLTWNKSNSSNVIGYKVYRNVRGNENEFILLTPLPVKETSYTDTLSKGALNDFYYKVVALNQKYMNSDYSQPVTVKLKDVVPPSVPLISNISIENNAVVLNWIPQFESDLAGYKIYRSEDSASGFTEISNPAKGINSFKDNSVTANKTYYYKISSADISGNISTQSDLSMITLGSGDAQVPSIKINISYNKAANSVDVSWENAPAASSQVKGYLVMRRDGEDEFSYSASEVIIALNFSDTNIETPAKYNYSIKIIYDNGDVVTTPEQSIETN
jgi:fibronectin type 3 domain-containing protein